MQNNIKLLPETNKDSNLYKFKIGNRC